MLCSIASAETMKPSYYHSFGESMGRLVALGSELMLLYQKDYFWQVPSDNLSEYCDNEIKIVLIPVKLFCLVMYSLC